MSEINNLTERYPRLAPLGEKIQEAFELLLDAVRGGGKILICGNGGSASDAEHIVGELMKGFKMKRPIRPETARKIWERDRRPQELIGGLEGAIPAISLNSQTSLLTALCNDGDPAMIFAQQVYGYGKLGDVLIALSASGNSANVVNAARLAGAMDIPVISLSGSGGGKLGTLADVALCLPEKETYKVQELTLPVYHCLCLMLEEAIFA